MTVARHCPGCGAYSVGPQQQCLKCSAALLHAPLVHLSVEGGEQTSNETVSSGARSEELNALDYSGEGWLHFLSGELAGKRLKIYRNVSVGRHPSCDITLDDPLLSRQHARIGQDDAGFFVVDQESSNGTLLNGAPVLGTARLTSGALLVLGATRIRFELV